MGCFKVPFVEHDEDAGKLHMCDTTVVKTGRMVPWVFCQGAPEIDKVKWIMSVPQSISVVFSCLVVASCELRACFSLQPAVLVPLLVERHADISYMVV